MKNSKVIKIMALLPLITSCAESEPAEQLQAANLPVDIPQQWSYSDEEDKGLLFKLSPKTPICLAPKQSPENLICRDQNACQPQSCASGNEWWHLFNDEELNALIAKALNNNNDLKIAEARITEAKAISRESLSKLLPSVDATASVNRTDGQASLGNSDKLNSSWQTGASLNWVPDLFGQSRAELEASQAGAERLEADYGNTRLNLISEIARTYTEARALQQRISLTVSNLKLEEETLRVTRIQYEAQAVSKLDMLRANAQVETTRAELPSIEALLFTSYNRLALLTGQTPGSLSNNLKEPGTVPKLDQKLLLSTPAQVIASRPDIKAAEANLRQATLLEKATTADIFPKISLSAFLGTGGASLYQSSNPFTLGASALLPLLDFGRIESRIDAADARKVQALYAYKQAILKALEDVENSLISYDREIIRAESLNKAAESNQEAARLARIKYQAGDATFLDLLIAEERLLAAQSDSLISHANVTKYAISLATALALDAKEPPPVLNSELIVKDNL